MTSRQRFHETMRFGKPDHVPYFEEGIRKDVIKSWYHQGLSRKTNLSNLFKTDHLFEIELDFDPLLTLSQPPSSVKELSLLRNSLSKEKLHHLSRKWLGKLRLSEMQDAVIFLRVHSGFFLSMGVYSWSSFEEVISSMLNNPDFVRDSMLIQVKLIAEFLDLILNKIKIDAVIFSEPIGGNEGPLISPTMYEEFVLKGYSPILDIINKHKIDVIIMRTYANIRIFIPYILKYGFNCLWACETNSKAMDYRDIRKVFGRDLRLIGGIDLDTLRHGKELIRKEIEEKVPPLIASGGYIPIADGRVRKDILFENYVFYRQLLNQIVTNKF